MKRTREERRFALCIHNEDCDDLELRKLYEILPDKTPEQDGYIRVVDESDLYPADYFLPIQLSAADSEKLQLLFGLFTDRIFQNRRFSARHIE